MIKKLKVFNNTPKEIRNKYIFKIIQIIIFFFVKIVVYKYYQDGLTIFCLFFLFLIKINLILIFLNKYFDLKYINNLKKYCFYNLNLLLFGIIFNLFIIFSSWYLLFNFFINIFTKEKYFININEFIIFYFLSIIEILILFNKNLFINLIKYIFINKTIDKNNYKNEFFFKPFKILISILTTELDYFFIIFLISIIIYIFPKTIFLKKLFIFYTIFIILCFSFNFIKEYSKIICLKSLVSNIKRK